ncbi:MAG: hypothetical protein ACO1N0_12510 [Fluviicola sp.]
MYEQVKTIIESYTLNAYQVALISIGVSVLTSSSLLVDSFVFRNCPNTKPETVIRNYHAHGE